MFMRLTSCDLIGERRHCLLTGPSGVGKSWLACGLAYKACRENQSVFYQRVPRLFAALALARFDGRYARLLTQLAKVDLLILDDWGPAPLLPEQQRDLLEIVEDRYSAGSLITTSQVPIDHWHDLVGNLTLAHAILDRIVHNAHRIEVKGESLRKPPAVAWPRRTHRDTTKTDLRDDTTQGAIKLERWADQGWNTRAASSEYATKTFLGRMI